MGPGGLEKVFPRYELSFFVSKCQKNIHCSASEVHLLSPEQQLAMSRAQSERTKIHDLVRFNCRHVSKSFLSEAPYFKDEMVRQKSKARQ
jgi:hypothetical protein